MIAKQCMKFMRARRVLALKAGTDCLVIMAMTDFKVPAFLF